MPEPKDALDLILEGGELDDDGNVIEDGETVTKEDLDALKAELAQAKKENHGMLQELKGDRAKRQRAQTELAELRGTVNGILKNRNAELDKTVVPEEALRTAVTYDDDGDAYVELDKATKPMFDDLKNEIKELKNFITQTNQATQASAQGDALIASIVGEKPEYGAAYGTYQAAHKWLDNRVVAWQNANGVTEPMSGGQALDFVFQDDKEFNEAFPTLNIADILLAEDSEYQLRQMLHNVTEGSNPDFKKPDTRFQKLMKQPSGLGANANAKTEISVVEKAGNLAATDIMALSDEAAEQLEKAMAREESSEGIKF